MIMVCIFSLKYHNILLGMAKVLPIVDVAIGMIGRTFHNNYYYVSHRHWNESSAHSLQL